MLADCLDFYNWLRLVPQIALDALHKPWAIIAVGAFEDIVVAMLQVRARARRGDKM